MPAIKIQNSETLQKCPHCEKELGVIEKSEQSFLGGIGGSLLIFNCPHCKKVLGISTSFGTGVI